MAKSPVARAAGQAQTVAAELRKRAKQADLPLPGGELPFVFGHAVAFPFATLSADPNQLGIEMPRTIAIDRTDYPNLEQKICDGSSPRTSRPRLMPTSARP